MAPRTTLPKPAAQAAHIRAQFAFFISKLGDVTDKVIAEIGPGDTFALGALFLNAGARQYIAFDRFSGNVYGSHAQAIYKELGCQPDPARVVQLGSIEEAKPVSVDAIVSFNVLEHLSSPTEAIANMSRMLKSNGAMIHRVDYGPHDVWRSYPNSLTFLTIPDWLWRLMGSNRGYPNRIRHPALIRAFIEQGFITTERVIEARSADVDAAISCGLDAQELRVLEAEIFCHRSH